MQYFLFRYEQLSSPVHAILGDAHGDQQFRYEQLSSPVHATRVQRDPCASGSAMLEWERMETTRRDTMAGSINWTDLATEAQAIGPLLSAIAILAAIAAGVLPPRIAGVIEQRRWRSTSLRLAVLLHDSIDEFAAQHGVSSQRHGQDRTLARDTLMLRALVERCEGWPADSIGDADALEAFIRLAGVGRFMLENSAKFQGRLSREATNELLSDIDRLRTQAELQFRRFEECQRHCIKV